MFWQFWQNTYLLCDHSVYAYTNITLDQLKEVFVACVFQSELHTNFLRVTSTKQWGQGSSMFVKQTKLADCNVTTGKDWFVIQALHMFIFYLLTQWVPEIWTVNVKCHHQTSMAADWSIQINFSLTVTESRRLFNSLSTWFPGTNQW